MNRKKIALVVMLVMSSATSGVAFAGQGDPPLTDSEPVTLVDTRIVDSWGEGFDKEVLVAFDWSDGSTTYEVRRVEFG